MNVNLNCWDWIPNQNYEFNTALLSLEGTNANLKRSRAQAFVLSSFEPRQYHKWIFVYECCQRCVGNLEYVYNK